MILVNLEQQHVIGMQIDPLQQRVQKLVAVSPQYVRCLMMILLPQRISPSLRPVYSGPGLPANRATSPQRRRATRRGGSRKDGAAQRAGLSFFLGIG